MRLVERLIVLTLLLLASGGCASPGAGTDETFNVPLDAIPKLNVVVDCGGCAMTANTPVLIRDAYRQEAVSAGAKILADAEAILTIKEYQARHPGARVLLGVLSGTDRITAAIAYRGRQVVIEEHTSGAIGTIDDVARMIGRAAFNKIAVRR